MVIVLVTLAFQSCNQSGGETVKTIEEFNTAMQTATPGDKIVLANGVWENTELLIDANGTAENPIVVTAEEKGKVILTGLSNLRISGEYIEVSGLVFKDGYTPTSEVITFREKKGVYAHHCRLTECVIDNFNNPERSVSETWIAIYGKNNRVDHCYLTDKRCRGVTMTVRMVDEACRENNHRIDHNYFGYRQNYGSNGGETLRLGTSHYSLSTCGTTVEANYFDRCDGEHEIISNKSCGNTFKNNTFYECRGTLTYRHGHDNTSEGNFFFGNGKDHTGGIRIINERNDKGLLFPVSPDVKNAGCTLDAPHATKENTGVDWYELKEEELSFDNGNEILVEPGLNTLFDALATSKSGDILLLNDGEFVNNKDLFIKHPVTIKAGHARKATLYSEKNDMFTILNEGALKLLGLKISGAMSPDMAGNTIVSTSKYSMNRNYKLIVEDCDIENLLVNHSFDFLRVFKSTFADSVVFRNCSFKDISGSIAELNKETDDIGVYNAEYVIYENSTFKNVGKEVLNLYRGGTDESTFGPSLTFKNCQVNNSGYDKRNKIKGSIYLHGVQVANISESGFNESAPFMLHLTNGEPVTNIIDLNIYPKAQIQANSNEFKLKNLTHNKL